MQPSTILMNADVVGGVWTYALELIRGLTGPHASGHESEYGRGEPFEVALATLGGRLSPSQARDAAAIPRLTVYESSYKLEWMEDPWADVDQSGAWLLEIADEVQPDIVHLNTYAHGALPWQAPVLMVGHSCVLSWWLAVKGEHAPPQWETYRRRVQSGLRRADRVVAPTRAMLHNLQRIYGPLARTQVIHNGHAASRFRPARKEPYILAAGRIWDEAKNIAALEQVAADVPWPIYVAGQEDHPLGGRRAWAKVRPLGILAADELARRMAHASIYALPARYEPFGLSALEAALSGCALVLGDIASLREVWGPAACYVPPGDSPALAETLRDLIAHPARRDALAAAAYGRAHRYGAAAMTAAYRRAYASLLEQHRIPLSEPFSGSLSGPQSGPQSGPLPEPMRQA